MKIGRNQPCPCGSGLKYKKCCLNKTKEENKILNSDDVKYMEKHNFIDPFTYHDNYIHTKKVRATKINKKLLNIYDNKKNLSIKNIIDDFEEEILNLNIEEYDLNITNNYLDKLVSILELDDNTYENSLRCKVHSLFKLGNYELGEQIILDWIKENRNSIYAYIELVDDYEMIGNLEKSKYYYDLGMKRTDLEDLDALGERKDYFKK